MVRGAEAQFAYQIDILRKEEGFDGGSVITKDIETGDGDSYGKYAYLVSPPSHGREWYYLGKYKRVIDLQERINMDYNRLMYRLKELGREYRMNNIKEDLARYQYPKYKFVYDESFLNDIKGAKFGDDDLEDVIYDCVFSRGTCPVDLNPVSPSEKLTKLLLEHLIEEVNDIHLPEGESIKFDLDQVLRKKEEWGRTPYTYQQYAECKENDTEPDFVN